MILAKDDVIEIRNGDKVLNSELRRELAVIGQTFISQNQGG